MVFFVTGGSRGIGRAIVLAAIGQGHDVAFTYHQRGEAAQETMDQARTIRPEGCCRAFRLDVRDSGQVECVADEALAAFDSVDVVVANAGINRDGLAATMPDDDWRLVIDTNLTGTFFVVRQFLPTLLANGRGRIVIISSVSRNGGTGQANYAASKAGLIGLSGTLAKEYGRKGITSNVVVPGFFDTEMTRQTMAEPIKAFWHQFCPVGRMGELDELTGMVLFLASDSAAFVNGQVLSVSGGLDWVP